jgi:hypothetical protein
MAALGHMLLVSVKHSCSSRSNDLKCISEVAFVGKAVGAYVMLLGGGYYGQRLNKIYRGRANILLSHPFFSVPYCPSIFLRERDGARNLSYSQANDQTLRSREARRRTLWRFRDTSWLYITRDGGKGMV